jgi:hypothetical protein
MPTANQFGTFRLPFPYRRGYKRKLDIKTHQNENVLFYIYV